jgi:hypothetical protein
LTPLTYYLKRQGGELRATGESTVNKEVQKLKRELEQQGFTVRQSKGTNHYHVFKGPKFVTGMPCTPSDYHGLKNAKAYCRASGFQDKDNGRAKGKAKKKARVKGQ